ncbi:desulfoferrodoxin family protein [archaeon]
MAKKRGDILKTPCGGIIEVLSPGECTSSCSNRLSPIEEKAADEGKEKHVPVVEKTDGGILVRVGSVAHPMEAEHWIQWIEVTAGDDVYLHYLSPGDAPEAEFPVADYNLVREYCSIHGLWKA